MGKYIQIKTNIQEATKLIAEAVRLSESLRSEVDGPWIEMEEVKRNLNSIIQSLSNSLTPIHDCIEIEEKYIS